MCKSPSFLIEATPSYLLSHLLDTVTSLALLELHKGRSEPKVELHLGAMMREVFEKTSFGCLSSSTGGGVNEPVSANLNTGVDRERFVCKCVCVFVREIER